MYKVIDVTDDLVYILNPEELQVMKINKSKISWDVKINDYMDFKFTDDDVIVTKVENCPNKKDNVKTAVTDINSTQKNNSKNNNVNSNTLYYQNDTKDTPTIVNNKISSNKTNPTIWIGVILAIFAGFIGLLIGIFCCNNDEDKSAFIRGWFIAFVSIIAEIIFLLLLYFFTITVLL